MKKINNRIKYLLNRIFLSIKKDGILLLILKIKKFILRGNKIDLDLLQNKYSKECLDDLFIRFGTDKGTLDGKKTYYVLNLASNFRDKFKNYYQWINREKLYEFDYQLGLNFTPYYEKHFSELREKKLNILEIGVANGHSFAAFFNYFLNSNFFGIDLKDNYKLFYKSKRYNYFKVDILSQKEINNFKKKKISFDIIIDDSLHDQLGVTTNFKNFYPLLNDKGYYVVEDFKLDDLITGETRDYNHKNNKQFFFFTQFTCGEIFNKIGKKEYFEHSILDNKFLNDVYGNDNIVNTYYGESPFSSICFINKNVR